MFVDVDDGDDELLFVVSSPLIITDRLALPGEFIEFKIAERHTRRLIDCVDSSDLDIITTAPYLYYKRLRKQCVIQGLISLQIRTNLIGVS